MSVRAANLDKIPGAIGNKPLADGADARAFQSALASGRNAMGQAGRPVRVAQAARVLEAPALTLPELGAALPEVAVALRALTGVAGAATVLVAPTNSSHDRQGILPGRSDIGYSYRISETTIAFYRVNPDGSRGETLWAGSRTGMLDADGVPVADATTIERGAGSRAVPVTMATPAAPQSASSAAIHDRAGLRVSPRAMSMKPPGDCTPNQHQRMQREVRRACDQPRRCIPGMTPAELLTRMERNRECAMARDIINKTCFAGGDLDHRNEAIRAWGLVARCESLSP